MRSVVCAMRRPLSLIVVCFVCVLFQACPDPNAIPCEKSQDCPTDLYCIDSLCQEKACTINEQCGVNQICDKKKKRCKRSPQPTWRCNDDRDCRAGEECLEGTCRVVAVKPCDPACQEDETCVRGTCEKKVTKPECKTTEDCADNLECQGGRCVLKADTPCKLDTDCTAPMRCNLFIERCQTPCTSTADCEGGRACRDQFCQLSCSEKLPCPAGKACKAGECVPAECSKDKPCASPKRCSGGLCVDPECSTAKDCKDQKVCKQGRCIEPECGPSKRCTAPNVCKDGLCGKPSNKCDPNNPCPQGKKCWKGQCAPADYCERAADCGAGQSCENNQCKGGSTSGCKSDRDCKTGEQCDNGTCKPKSTSGIAVGSPCQQGQTCVNGALCIGDGVTSQNYCRKICDPIKTNPGCPPNQGCALLGNKRTGACFPKNGGKPAGSSCDPNKANDCEVGTMCIQNGSANLCMKFCDVGNPNCPNGETCASLNIDPVGACVPKVAKKEGDSCTKRSECGTMFCLAVSGSGVCTPACDPYKPSCSAGKSCILLMRTPTVLEAAVCGPIVGTTPPGRLCDANRSTCVSTAFCFPNLKNLSQSLCSLPCDPKAPRCPSGQQCVLSPVTFKGANLYGCI